jgi:erythrin-vacuolar iron transport family protein
MGFAEALSDDGKLSGRGGPAAARRRLRPDDVRRGIGHTLPYLISNFYTATAVAMS